MKNQRRNIFKNQYQTRTQIIHLPKFTAEVGKDGSYVNAVRSALEPVYQLLSSKQNSADIGAMRESLVRNLSRSGAGDIFAFKVPHKTGTEKPNNTPRIPSSLNMINSTGYQSKGSIIEVIIELKKSVGDIDKYYCTLANERQAITNVVIDKLKTAFETKDVSEINYDLIMKEVMSFKFPDEETGPSYKPGNDNKFWFEQPTLSLKDKTVKEMTQTGEPDSIKNHEYVKNILKSFFGSTDQLKSYYEESKGGLGRTFNTDRWSGLTKDQYEKLLKLQNIYYMMLLQYYEEKVWRKND